ncbi:MAG: hypothetical protein ACRCXZ_03215 [Patescibacteria group bacterium]
MFETAFESFKNKRVGLCNNYDGAFHCQCVDIINFYILEVYNTKPFMKAAYANQIGKNPRLLLPDNLQYDLIKNPQEHDLKKGDILVWGNSIVNGVNMGHIAIYNGEGTIISANNYPPFSGVGAKTEIKPLSQFPGVSEVIRIKR